MTTGAHEEAANAAIDPAGSSMAGAPPVVIGPWLAQQLDNAAWQDCHVELIAGGKSNLTYLVSCAAGEVVLRRPPMGQILPTAHDMGRESTVLRALAPSSVPVPQVLAVCTDGELLGQPFYVMERVIGHIVRDMMPPGYAESPAQRSAMADGLLATLAELHAVDAAAVGLAEFGRPEGYLERQVRRWSRQWQASRTDDLPALDALAAELTACLPQSPPPTIVHGDYRLDNCILDPETPGVIRAVLDWEMSTLGDPLADVGLLLVYWAQAGDPARPAAAVVPTVTSLPGFPTRSELVESYAMRTGRDVSALPFYVAFGYFKLAVVCQGIVARVAAGAMGGQGFAGYSDLVHPLVELGRTALADNSVG